MTDKPKRKNLSPDELLKQAKLLHPENEAFVRGVTKNLYHTNEVYGNFYFKRGFGLNGQRLRNALFNKWDDFATTLMLALVTLPLGACGTVSLVYGFFKNFEVGWIILGMIVGLFAMLLILVLGIGFAWNAWQIATTNKQFGQKQLTQLAQEGKLILGEVILQSSSTNFSASYHSFRYTYISPETHTQRTNIWHVLRPVSNDTQKIILLYLNDNCVIVL